MAKDRKRKHRNRALDANVDDVDDLTKALPTSPSTTPKATASTTNSTHKRRRTTNNSQVLNGMVIAISTLITGEDSNNENEEAAKTKASRDDLLHSYRQVSDDCRANGAKVSGQVHKKVHCLLCTSAAIVQSTQRVRKALKNRVPLVDITWVYQCLEQGRKLSFDGFLLQPSLSLSNAETKTDEDIDKNAVKDSKKEKKRDKKKKAKTSNHLSDIDIDHDNEPLPDAGWTDPVEVGCCCVCHETGQTATCEWCKNCHNNHNVNDKETKEDVAANPDAGWSEPVSVGCCCLCHETGETANCQWCPDCK